MGAERKNRRNGAFRVGIALLLCAAASFGRAGEPAWKKNLKPATVGPFPEVRPFVGEFRFGWSGVEAASAKAAITMQGDKMVVKVEGGTNGLARTLWQLDAWHDAYIYRNGLRPDFFQQNEKYAKKQIFTQAAFKPDGLWRLRRVTPDLKNSSKWKRIKVEPIRDIISAMFFIRSQPLANGDKIVVTAFPGDSPYLVEVNVLGRETVKVDGKAWQAIKLDFELQRIVTNGKRAGSLEPQGKFRHGTVWLSDDGDRVPIRAEVDIFIGYVFGELKSITFAPPK